MKSFDYPVETFESVVEKLDEFAEGVSPELYTANKNYLSRIVKGGKEKTGTRL